MTNAIVKRGDLSLALQIAKEAAREAGAFLLSRQGHALVLHKKAERDDLLDVDEAAEDIILTKLRVAFPTYGIHSEEAGVENADAAYVWIVDPLDGSANFQHGSPIFGVAIGLICAGDMVLSVIYLPMQDEMYCAMQGQGAYLNDERIQVSQIDRLGSAVIYAGDFAKTGNHRDNAPRIAVVSRLADAAYRVRMIGTAATDFAYLACGRGDGLIMYNANPWDLKAGQLLLEEAGGQATRYMTRSGTIYNLFSNPKIHHELLAMVRRVTIPRRRRHELYK